MATPVLIPVDQYLSTSYNPDCDYIEGEVRERNMGERPHSLLQMVLAAVFFANRRAWSVIPLPEQRVQISASRFRIPDLCLVAPGSLDPIVRTAPILCVEILSSGQTLRDMQERTDDYLAMGVRHIWIFDPVRRQAFIPNAKGLLQSVTGTLHVDETPVMLKLDDIFREYDDLAAGR